MSIGLGSIAHPLTNGIEGDAMVAETVAIERSLAGQREQWATRLVFLAVGFALAAWAPLVPFAKTRLGVDEGALGLLLLSLGAGSIVAMPLTGILATRYGCRAILIVGVVAFAIALPFLATASGVVSLAIALALFGAAIGTVDVAVNIQAVMVERDSGRAMMSGFHGLFSLGGILGAGGMSGLLMLGVSPLSAALGFGLFAILLLALAVPGLLPYGNAEAGEAPPFAVPHGIVVFIGALCFIVFLAEGTVLDWSALFLISERGVEPAAGGYGYALFAVAMTAGRLLGDRIVTWLGGVRVIVLGGLIAAFGFALIIAVPNAAASLLGFLLVGVGASNIVPVLFTAAGRQTDMPASLAVAAITTLGYAGILAGPALVGFIAQLSDLSVAFGILAVAMAAVGASGKVARQSS